MEVRDTRQVDGAPIAQLVGRFEGPDVIAAQSSSRRWIVIRRLLGRDFLGLSHFREQHRPGRSRADTIDKVAPRDLAVHPKTAIVRIHDCLQSELKLNTYSRNARS